MAKTCFDFTTAFDRPSDRTTGPARVTAQGSVDSGSFPQVRREEVRREEEMGRV